MESKKAQMTIWIIIAIVLVGAILLFFLLERRAPSVGVVGYDIEPYLQSCVSQGVNEAVEIMLPQGGFLAPAKYKVYNDTNVSYLCLHIGYFKPCINQHPMFINEMSNEIYGYILPRVESCFEDVEKEIGKKNGQIELGKMNFSVKMAPGKIIVEIEREAKITFGGETRTASQFDVEVKSPAYDLANVALEIANNEAKYCYFVYDGYMILYPRWDIKVWMMSDFTKIYTVKDKNSGIWMRMATRSCAMPPGMGI
jgi:hypothetical protein